MPFATITTAGSRPRRRRGRRRPHPYGLFSFILAYIASLSVLALTAAVGGLLAIPVYFIVGIALTRFIGNRIRWWKIENNVENVAATKVSTVLTWPISVPKFIVAVALAKWL